MIDAVHLDRDGGIAAAEVTDAADGQLRCIAVRRDLEIRDGGDEFLRGGDAEVVEVLLIDRRDGERCLREQF